MNKEPIKLTPAFKDYLWGGTKLKTEFNKKTDLPMVAESWELSTHKDGPSTVASGESNGMTLSEYIEKNGNSCLGTNAEKFTYFPILIKFIDALNNLSIQVHPSDEYALKNAGEYGKTEMWYILECDEGAYLYYGVNRTISRDEFRERINNNTLLEVLNKVPVHKGDVFFIKSGTIHAICSGIVICEIQQNSNLTYRVYDYDRRDKNGNPRELHIEKAIEVSELSPSPVNDAADRNSDDCILASCDKFTVRKVKVDKQKTIKTDTMCFRSVIITDGSGTLSMNGKTYDAVKGDSFFIPAQDGEFTLAGSMESLISYV